MHFPSLTQHYRLAALALRVMAGAAKANTMTPTNSLLADIAMLEAARAALPPGSHISSLFDLALERLKESLATTRPAPKFRRAA